MLYQLNYSENSKSADVIPVIDHSICQSTHIHQEKSGCEIFGLISSN